MYGRLLHRWGEGYAMTTAEGTTGRWLCWMLALLSAAAGVIHLASAGEHFDVTWAHGAFFAVVGWLQVVVAAALVLRPGRRVVALGAALSAGVIATWAVSRTVGVPFGPGAGEPEPVELADAVATACELVFLVVGLAVVARPGLTEKPLAPRLAWPTVALGGVALAALSTVSLTPGFAGGHAHGGGDDDGGHGHAAMSAEQHEAMGHGAQVIAADGTSPCEEAGIANEGNSGGHGHRGPTSYEPLDRATRSELAVQVAAADAVVARYPTVADAEAAGYRRVSPYVPCIAAHYIRTDELMANGFDPEVPEVILYAGTDPDSEVVGLSYLVRAEEEPEGFAGPNDPWHVHERICIGEGGVIGIETATEEGCRARGGRMIDVGNIWMTHMWNVPAWESRWGLFSSEHPDLGGRIGDIDGPPDPEADDAWFEENPVDA
jgi:hypothetical protein